MKAFFQEYGLIIVSILLASMILIFWNNLIGSDHGLDSIYNRNELFNKFKDMDGIGGEEIDEFGGVQNSVDQAYSPYFKITDIESLDDTFRLDDTVTFNKVKDESNTSSGYHYNLVIKDKKENGLNILKERLTGNFDTISVIKRSSSGEEKETDLDKLTIVIVESRPRIGYVTSEGGVVKEQYLTEDIDALDKFGNRIYDNTNNVFVKSSQIAYDTIVWNVGGEPSSEADREEDVEYKDINKFTVNPEIPSRYRVLYRYQDGALKCEYTKIFLNEVRTEYDILFGDESETEGGESTE